MQILLSPCAAVMKVSLAYFCRICRDHALDNRLAYFSPFVADQAYEAVLVLHWHISILLSPDRVCDPTLAYFCLLSSDRVCDPGEHAGCLPLPVPLRAQEGYQEGVEDGSRGFNAFVHPNDTGIRGKKPWKPEWGGLTLQKSSLKKKKKSRQEGVAFSRT